MDNMQRRLDEARNMLLDAQAQLAHFRKGPFSTWAEQAEREFLRCLDRAWEAQCMAQGSL